VLAHAASEIAASAVQRLLLSMLPSRLPQEEIDRDGHRDDRDRDAASDRDRGHRDGEDRLLRAGAGPLEASLKSANGSR
jgi:hypothetical protein